jgi:hypothetical protein
MRESWMVCALVLLGAPACMPEIRRTRIEFEPSAPGPQPVACLTADTRVEPQVGFGATLRSGSCWRRVGVTASGEVYRPVDAVFMLNSANAHEAYLVLSGRDLVGFYLPGENAFAPAKQSVPLPLIEKGDAS